MSKPRWHIPALLGFAALLFFTNIGGYDLWPADEPRYAQVAREMMQSGDYLAPHVNSQPYKEKPPLLFWAIAAASLPFGDVTEFSARVPSVLAALVTVLCTYSLARRLYGARVAFWSALVLITGARFWWQARTVQIDMLLTACLTAALLSFRIWQENRRARWLAAFYGAIAAAVYAKGPPGIIFPLLLIFTFYWRRKEERRQTHWVLGTLAVAGLIALWLIPARMAVAGATAQPAQAGIASNLFHQTVGRFFLGVSKAQPPWYYLKTLVVDLLPWSLFLPWAWRRREGPGMRLLLSWTVPALVFFSVCIGKRAIYILPLFPALAILIARSVLDLMESDRASWRKRTAMAWGLLLIVMGLAPLALRFTQYRDAWSSSLLIFSLCALGFAGDTIHRVLKTGMRSLHVTLACHFAVLALLCALFVFPLANSYLSARGFCEPLRLLSEAGHEYRLYSVGFSREEYVFYAKHFHEPVLTDTLPLPASSGIDPEIFDKAQKHLHKAIQKTIIEDPFDFSNALTDADIQAFRSAFEKGVAEAGEDPLLAKAFENALRNALEDFANRFESPTPAFMFVREDTWRTLLPLYTQPPEYSIIRHAQVGHRVVLLMANPAGAALDRASPRTW